ncbi:MAG: nitrite/sulfite reductase [Deltaproteobacteria bacterium]|nr:nitrite/sulfite reductase [Deltaproteobacteria bacterium]
MTHETWKQALDGRIPAELAQEIDAFEGQLELKKQGRIGDKLFAETRLRRGAYGQRYDNGLRHDGSGQQTLAFPSGELTKGPGTLWDAPGMMRVKIPFGAVTPEQLELLAELAEEYSDGILHVTTRQDIQLHFVQLEDTPDLMRRLGAVGITTREACGNAVRNVSACPFAGTCHTESFDVTPHAQALADFLLGHPDTQDFGRKFKASFSGCADEPCGLTRFHDLGLVARQEMVAGEPRRGFLVFVGGGLGAVPVQAKVLTEFCPEEELLPTAQALCRVFAQHGERESRARARLKFLVQKIGIERLRELVEEERATLLDDPRWTAHLPVIPAEAEPKTGGAPLAAASSPSLAAWQQTNLRAQAQEGYQVASVALPLGDFTAEQARGLADLGRRFSHEPLRFTVEQNVALRWVSGADAPALHAGLEALGLADDGVDGLLDPTSCPGTDTCKLGISSSRGLARELRRSLRVIADELDPAVKRLRIKASGCFNSCGQHHVADLGFLGVSRSVGGRRVPHFNLVLGGRYRDNGGAYGVVVGAVPARNVPEAVQLITRKYADERQDDESLEAFVARVGKASIRKLLAPISRPPAYDVDPSYYRDFGDPREYSLGDIGIGECAGELVPAVEFALSTAEQKLWSAHDELETGASEKAAEGAYRAMLLAAAGLVRHLGGQLRDDPDEVVAAFREQVFEPGHFHDPFAKGKFGRYLFALHEQRAQLRSDGETAQRVLDEARLFLEAAYACTERLLEASQPASEINRAPSRPRDRA